MNDLAQILPADFARRHLRTGRQLIEEQRDRPDEGTMPTGTHLDTLLRGGLERGRVTELTGRGARFSVVVSALAAATRGGEAAALIDLGDGFDPRGALAAGVELERLLWARPRHIKELLRCTEAVLDAGLPLVVLDLGLPPVPGGRGAEAFWLRLARSAQSQRTALLVSSPYRACGTAAHTVIESRGRRGRWLGHGAQPRLLDGALGRLQVAKSGTAGRDWRQPTHVELALRLPSAVAIDDPDQTGKTRSNEKTPANEKTQTNPRSAPRSMPHWATA